MKKKNKTDNISYIMKMIWRADKGMVAYTFYKVISEQVFYVFFFVYMTQYIYSCIENQSPFTDLFWFVLLLCCIHIVVHLVSAGYAYYLKRHTPEVYRYIFDKIISKSTEMEYKRFEQPDFYDKFTRALDESITRAMDTLNAVAYFIACVLAAVMAMVVVVQTDWILLLFIIPSVAASFYFGSKTSKANYELDLAATHDKRVTTYTKRVFYEKKYAGEIRLFGIRDVLLKRHGKAFESLYGITKKYRRKMAFYEILRWCIFVGMSLSVPMIYVAFVVKNTPGINVAPYVAMVTALEFIAWNISDSIEQGINIRKNDLYIKNLRDFLDYKPEVTKTAQKEASEPLGDICFKNVSFTYEGASSATLKGLDISIKKGERVAFVGHNGAGKTTLVKLLMGLYDTSAGEITINGVNINQYEPKSFHTHFGTVFQDLQVFALPISENVLMRAPQNDEERRLVETALEKAQFGEKLKKLPKGIDSMVSKEFDEEGVVLSGGETQKIAIARVFAKNPDIVILDEPSSALDPIAEYNMYKNMMEIAEDKTVIFISHRLSSARIADRIYMLENGTVIETGTHDELMLLGGKYSAMFTLQAQNYQESLPKDMEEALNAK